MVVFCVRASGPESRALAAVATGASRSLLLRTCGRTRPARRCCISRTLVWLQGPTGGCSCRRARGPESHARAALPAACCGCRGQQVAALAYA